MKGLRFVPPEELWLSRARHTAVREQAFVRERSLQLGF
jgi:hypothetical protein